MKLIFLGAPGVGKGTYSKKIMAITGSRQISTGDLLREAVKNQTELGLKAKEYMDSGSLVPDQLVIDLLKEKIQGMDSYILDGFPRTIPQAEALDEEIKIDKVVSFEAPEELIIQRLSGRRVCKSCGSIFHIENIPPKQDGVCDNCGGELFQRDDDKPEAIKHRLVVYREQTEPLIKHYKEKGLLVTVDA
ncbi:adenylate kinase, partial [Candidatus Woesearchaeota archaeon]|nr:adenylate kinase [Candidatus Woesearchaeota archaeon]